MVEKRTSKAPKAKGAKKTTPKKKATASSKKKGSSSSNTEAKKDTNKKTARSSKNEKKSEGFAIIETGGKQYKVSESDVIQIEKLSGEMEQGSKVIFKKVLLADNGAKTEIGTPYLEKRKVEGELVEQGRDKKISVIRFRSKSRHFKRKGHRQPYMKVKITKI